MFDNWDIANRVQCGIEYLNRAVGFGWWSRIDLDTLDLGDPTECVMGQLGLWGSWDLHLLPSTVRAYGFEAGLGTPSDQVVEEYAQLTEEWRYRIAHMGV